MISDFFDDMATSGEENISHVNEVSPPPTGEPDPAVSKLRTEELRLFVRKLKEAADDYSNDVNQNYEPGSWQEQYAAKLKTARDILDVLATFLETPKGQTITVQLLATFTRSIKTFAELLGPVMASFSISLYLCYAEACLHNSIMGLFSDEITHINVQLEGVKQIMPRLTEMIGTAGEQLKAFIQVCS